MERIGVWAVNGSLCIVSLLLLVSTGKHVVHAVLAPEISSIAATPPASAGIPKASWQDRKLIAESHLFQNAGEDETGGQQPTLDEGALPETNLPLKLLGTVVNTEPKQSMAAIRITDQNESVVVRQGEKVHGEAEVYRIERRRVVIINGRKTETLTLDEEATASPMANKIRSSLPQRPDTGTHRRTPRMTPPNNQRAMIDSIRRDPTSLLGMADFQPQFDSEGGVNGIRVTSVQPGSLAEQIGLSEGDVIKELNGITINNPPQSITLLREIQDVGVQEIVIETPGGQTNTLNY